jgi:hypothetical protein
LSAFLKLSKSLNHLKINFMEEELLFTAHGHSDESSNKRLDSSTNTKSPLMKKLDFGRITPNYPSDILSFNEEERGEASVAENLNIEAGWTYFGQFISHDLTINRFFDENEPLLRMRNLYGLGPKSNAYLYEFPSAFRGVKFAFGSYEHSKDKIKVQDLLRLPIQNIIDPPIIADVRNDENFILSQLHCLFMQFHNQVAIYYKSKNQNLSNDDLFEKTQKTVIWTYQYLIRNEYLPKLLIDKSLLNLPTDQFKIVEGSEKSFLLPEFIVAALRIGHSQVRQNYIINGLDGNFQVYSSEFPEKSDLRGYTLDKRRHGVNWAFLFDMDYRDRRLQFSRLIDTQISFTLTNLPFISKKHSDDKNLGNTNMKRSKEHNLLIPIEDSCMQKLNSLLGTNAFTGFDTKIKSQNLPSNEDLEVWPLWAFILKEAELLGLDTTTGNVSKKQTLGPLGSQLFAEQFLWILRNDKASYLQQMPEWNPMKDLIDHKLYFSTSFGIADIIWIAQNGINIFQNPQKIVHNLKNNNMTNLELTDSDRSKGFSPPVNAKTLKNMKDRFYDQQKRKVILADNRDYQDQRFNNKIKTALYAAMFQELFTDFPLADKETVGINFLWRVDDNSLLSLTPLPFGEKGSAIAGQNPPTDLGDIKKWLNETLETDIDSKRDKSTFSYTAAQIGILLQIDETIKNPEESFEFELVVLDDTSGSDKSYFTLGVKLINEEASWGPPCPPKCYP